MYDMNGTDSMGIGFPTLTASCFLSEISRKDNDSDNKLFCGSGSVSASDLMNYAAFMRDAFRGQSSKQAIPHVKISALRCAQRCKKKNKRPYLKQNDFSQEKKN